MKGTHLVAALVRAGAGAGVLRRGRWPGGVGSRGRHQHGGTGGFSERALDRVRSLGVRRCGKGQWRLRVSRTPSGRLEQGKGKAGAPKDSPAGSGNKQESERKPRTPAEGIASLSPSERRALHKDLYQQGQKLCYAYGPKELAKEFSLTGNDPQTIAVQYARVYEAAFPTLILPYQQGCLAGFRKFARNPPKN